jgi:CO/xanthine dehydrogenase Mo-binding subunit
VEAPQGTWGVESNMDCVAHQLDMDPLEFRMKNLIKEGDINAFGQVLHHSQIGSWERQRR